MKEFILVVDDSLPTLHRTAELIRKSGAKVLEALSPVQALEIVSTHQVAVVVSDYYMPKMDGNELLAKITAISPYTVKIMMTSSSNVTIAINSINQGGVYRFVRKPYDDNDLMAAVKEGVRRYKQLDVMRQEDERIIHSLAEAIELKDPYTRGHCERVARYSQLIAQALGLPIEMQRDIRFGSWLHDCGKIGVPEEILNACRDLENEEMDVVTMHPEWGANVADVANFSSAIKNIVRYHHENYDGAGYPAQLKGEEIPLEARIVAIADTYDAITSDRPYRPALGANEALEIMNDMRGTKFDPSLLDIFLEVICEELERTEQGT